MLDAESHINEILNPFFFNLALKSNTLLRRNSVFNRVPDLQYQGGASNPLRLLLG
jgi:hypothetical protein